jgi:glycosyltransferase involved in cell wall biosynthesis
MVYYIYMTIGIETTKAFEPEKTGVGWYCYYITREFAKLIDPCDELRLYVNPWSNVKCQMSNVKTLHWPYKFLWTQLRLSLEMMTNPPDVLFIPAHLPPLVTPKKLVATIHDLAFKQYPEVYSKGELMLQEWGIRRILKQAWRIIVPSEFTKSEIYKYYPKLVRDNIFVVPHGVEHSVFKSQKSKVKFQKCKSKIKNDLLYIGRLENKKNIINLIKAFNIIKNNTSISHYPISNIQLLLIGNPGFGYQAIKGEINASTYKTDIKELGWLDRKDIARHLCRATVFVLPSLYEGFGLPPLQAMACGAPVACSDIPPLREVGADVPVYFNPFDPNDIAKKIIKLIKNDDLRQEKIKAGMGRAKQFTWTKAARKTLEIIKGRKKLRSGVCVEMGAF